MELTPTSEQIQEIERTMGVCRYVYNLFIATNLDNYRNGTHEYMSGYDFSKWLNNDYRNTNADKLWIWEVSSKSVKKAIMNADKAYKDFMKGRKGFPKFKKRNGRPVGMYLPRNNQGDLAVERHRAKIPTLGWVRFKECGYVPRKARARSVTIRKRAGRYFASFVFEIKAVPVQSAKTAGIGIDLGVKSFAVISDGRNYPNINKTEQVHKARQRLKREQRKLSRKIRKTKQRKEGTASKKCKHSNLDKQRLKVQRAYMKLSNQRHDYINKTVHEIVITRPEYITVEDL
ncbi:MAG: transposase, partial [Synergistaceae bacterium]|nr:transposase [Synergistaceae bacterium]